VQREVAWRDGRRVARLLQAAKLKVASACIEDINWRASRSLDRALVATLASGDWLRHARNLLITGATGSGKTWLACALAHQAARSGFSVLYVRAARLFDELQVAHGDGSFVRRLAQLAKLDLMVIDDFAISPMGAGERNDLLELLDDRIGARSTLITSQLPVKAWHPYLNDPTLTDAILDRVVHSSHKIELKGTRSLVAAGPRCPRRAGPSRRCCPRARPMPSSRAWTRSPASGSTPTPSLMSLDGARMQSRACARPASSERDNEMTGLDHRASRWSSSPEPTIASAGSCTCCDPSSSTTTALRRIAAHDHRVRHRLPAGVVRVNCLGSHAGRDDLACLACMAWLARAESRRSASLASPQPGNESRLSGSRTCVRLCCERKPAAIS